MAKNLPLAQRLLSNKKPQSTAELLAPYKDDIKVLMDHSIPMAKILSGLEEEGLEISLSTLRRYMLSEFSDLFKLNYSSRAIEGAGRPKGSKNKEKDDLQPAVTTEPSMPETETETETEASAETKKSTALEILNNFNRKMPGRD